MRTTNLNDLIGTDLVDWIVILELIKKASANAAAKLSSSQLAYAHCSSLTLAIF
jgi:hypothetical protein